MSQRLFVLLPAAAIALVGAASLSHATPLTFDLDAGEYYFENPFATTAVWRESGFDVEFWGEQVSEEYVAPYPLNDNYMSDSGCCDIAYSYLDISRDDGSTFSFDGMEISRSFSDTWVDGVYRQYDAAGNLIAQEHDRARLNYDNIRLQGTRADGSTVNVFASGFTDITENPDVAITQYGYPDSRSEFLLQLGDPEFALLTDLTSLNISLGRYDDTFGIYQSSAAYVGRDNPLYEFAYAGDMSEIVMQGYNECLLVRRQESCVLDGVGEYRFYQEVQVFQNYANSMSHGDIMLTVNQPAPVPLPASGWLLVLAGGALIGLRRRARA